MSAILRSGSGAILSSRFPGDFLRVSAIIPRKREKICEEKSSGLPKNCLATHIANL